MRIHPRHVSTSRDIYDLKLVLLDAEWPGYDSILRLYARILSEGARRFEVGYASQDQSPGPVSDEEINALVDAFWSRFDTRDLTLAEALNAAADSLLQIMGSAVREERRQDED